jgi:hypothetical protein
LDSDGHGAQYQGVIAATDGLGYRRLLPTTAEVPPAVAGTKVAGGGSSARPGLYVGHVTVNEVSWVTAALSSAGDPTVLRPTSAEFRFPIIVHLSQGGAYRMLAEVTMMWHPGQDGVSPGRYVLVTPEVPPEILAQLEAGSLQDGEPFSRRVSTAAFSFDGDLALTGGFESALNGETTIPADHPLNPFKHGYHPDHDGLTPQGEPAPGELYEVTRAFTLAFDTGPPPGLARPGWGDSYLTGAYAEEVTGIHRDAVYAGGSFELQRISDVTSLNDQGGEAGR